MGVISANQDRVDAPVALVIQRRVADEGFALFSRWNGKVGERLKSWPGYLGQEVVPPQPPAQSDWIVIQRFANPDAAHAWLRSDEHAELVAEMRRHFIGTEDIHILPDTTVRSEAAVSAVISFKVPAGLEADFLAWQQRMQTAEAEFKGFLRHKVERPIPGLHDDWLIILSFDNDANLTAWLDSAVRRAFLKEGARFNSGISVKRASYGFNFWFPTGQTPRQGPSFILKSNLIVLLVLYPIVFLWGTFIGHPLIDAHGVPFWLSLFIGNLVSTQLLGWFVVPAAFKAFDWWLAPRASTLRQLGGYALVVALYAASMLVYAGLLAWK
jgi:antibiotic biosynthesis monooxygenase (ABM) superfamily enzyme